MTETAPLAPANPYGCSKAAAERVIADLAESNAWRWQSQHPHGYASSVA